MKRHILMLSLLALCTACDIESSDDPFTPVETSIDAILPYLDFGVECKWRQGEAVSVFAITGVEKDGVGSVYYDHCKFTASSDGATSALKGQAPAGADSYLGIYPYSDLNDVSGTQFKITIPQNQTAATAQSVPFPLCAYAIAYGSGQQLIFTPICAWLSFSLELSDIQSLSLSTDYGDISGTFGIYPDGEGGMVVSTIEAPTFPDVNITPPQGGFQKGEKYYVMIAASSWGYEGLCATITRGGAQSKVQLRGEPVFLQAGDVLDLGTISVQ